MYSFMYNSGNIMRMSVNICKHYNDRIYEVKNVYTHNAYLNKHFISEQLIKIYISATTFNKFENSRTF